MGGFGSSTGGGGGGGEGGRRGDGMGGRVGGRGGGSSSWVGPEAARSLELCTEPCDLVLIDP